LTYRSKILGPVIHRFIHRCLWCDYYHSQNFPEITACRFEIVSRKW